MHRLFTEIPLHEVGVETDTSSDSSSSYSDQDYGSHFNGGIILSKWHEYYDGKVESDSEIDESSNTTESSSQTDYEEIIGLICPNGEHAS